MMLAYSTYVGSPDRHESIAPRVGVLEHGTLPFISTSSQPAERKREKREKGVERQEGGGGEGAGRGGGGGEGGEVTLSVCSFCLSAYFTAEEWQS